MKQNQTFTVFVRYAYFNNRSGTGFDGLNLPELIEAASAFAEGHEPVAWAAEGTMGFGGFKHPDQLRAESIAAGRLIECINGKYIARIPGEVGSDFKREDEPAKPSWQEQAARHAKACEVPAPPATDQNAAMVARDGPARPAWQPAAQPTPEPANKPQGPHAAFFALRVDVPAGHLLGQGVKS